MMITAERLARVRRSCSTVCLTEATQKILKICASMFKRVPNPEECRQVSLLDATAVEVDPAAVSSLFGRRGLSEIPPHLKRVRKTGDKCLFLVHLGPSAADEDGIAVKVPEHPPCTQAQFQAAREAWPCHYCRSTEDAIDDRQATFFMRSVLRDIAAGASDSLGAVPATDSFPARLQPAYDNGFVQIKNTQESSHIKVSCAAGLQLRCSAGPVAAEDDGLSCFCSKICIICDGSEVLARCSDTEPVFGHAILEAVSAVSRSQRGYLCTGYAAYLYTEPCLSCAMALVHGRIRRVFCFKKAAGPGAPYSGLKFNYNGFLNHRYNVYFYEDSRSEGSQDDLLFRYGG